MSSEKIRRLQEEIRREEELMSGCEHTFDKPFFNPETVREPGSTELEVHGSDAWPVVTSWRSVEKDRWTRKCPKCGYEQHTYKQEPVVAGYQPKFD
jgi:hypothetical protein